MSSGSKRSPQNKEAVRRIAAPLTDAEIERIDTWGFSQRIRDRSTAIRLLLQAALDAAGKDMRPGAQKQRA